MGEGKHIDITPPPNLLLLGMGQALPMVSLHLVPKWVCRHCCTVLTETYPCPLLLLKCGSLTWRPPLVCVLTHINTYEPGVAGHWLGLLQVFVKFNQLKHLHKCCQCNLNPYGVSPRDASIVVIKKMSYSSNARSIPCWDSWGPQTFRKADHTTAFTTMLKVVVYNGSTLGKPPLCFKLLAVASLGL